MTEEKTQNTRKLDLSTAQIVGSALAAMSAAFFASWAGTAGTLIGAALGSLFATAGAAIYTWWLRRTSEAVRRTAVVVRETGMGSTVVVPGLRKRSSKDISAAAADGEPEEEEETGALADAEPSETSETSDSSDRWAFLRHRPWGKVALVAAGVMLTALASITVVEAITGKPLSSFFNDDNGTGTTVGRVVGRDEAPTREEPKDDTTKAPTPTPSESPTSTPTGEPTPTEIPTPSVTPTPTPTLPTPLPTEAPEGAAPAPTPEEGETPAP